MIQHLNLQQLLESASALEDVECQALEMESKLSISTGKDVRRVHERKSYSNNQNNQNKRPSRGHKHQDYTALSNKPNYRDKNAYQRKPGHKHEHTCQYCGYDHPGPSTNWVILPKCVRVILSMKNSMIRSILISPPDRSQNNSDSDSDYVFKVSDTNNENIHPTVKVRIFGVKGLMDADSCSSANIMDEDRFCALQQVHPHHIELQPT